MRNFSKIICTDSNKDTNHSFLPLEKSSKDDNASPRANEDTTNSDQFQDGKAQDKAKLKKFLTTNTKENEEKDKNKNVSSPSKKKSI